MLGRKSRLIRYILYSRRHGPPAFAGVTVEKTDFFNSLLEWLGADADCRRRSDEKAFPRIAAAGLESRDVRCG